MIVIKIALGLFGMGIVVLVHELGHFLAARAVGIGVEAFSIGWGNPILKKTLGGVEYRLGMFPIGGYCKMRGENEFREAWENRKNEIPQTQGTYYGASPQRRIIVSLAGPLFNLIFAVLTLSVIWGIGFEVDTLDNRIILVSDIQGGAWPADEAGLMTGDRIIKIDGQDTLNYHDVQEAVTPNAEKLLAFTVERDGATLELPVRPRLESSGAGRIGVYFWTDPVIGAVTPESPAALAGLREGDRILRVNGADFPHTTALQGILAGAPPVLSLEYERQGVLRNTDLVLSWKDGAVEDLGINWQTLRYHSPRYTPWGALAQGARETWKTLSLSVRSLGLLFRGIDLTQAVSGPVRITYMVGDATATGFGRGIGTGLLSLSNFLALISVALCIMNLLPLPVLDGGMALLFAVELLRRRPLNPKAVYAFQTLGAILIAGLMIFALFGDILFLTRR